MVKIPRACASAHRSRSFRHLSHRRLLAANVVCLFADERPVVANRCSGMPLPGNVIPMGGRCAGTPPFVRKGSLVQWRHCSTGEWIAARVHGRVWRAGDKAWVRVCFIRGSVDVFGIRCRALDVDAQDIRRVSRLALFE